MPRIAKIEQDGFTTCVIDVHGAAHCFRIDKEIGAELVAMFAAPAASEWTDADLELFREWYNAVCDLNPRFLKQPDHELAQHVRAELDRVLGAER